MLKQRVITAVVALAIIGVVLFVLPERAARGVLAAIALVGAWEWGGFLFGAGLGGRLGYVGLVFAVMLALLLVPGAAALPILEIALGGWFASLVWMFFYPTAVPAPVAWIAGLLVLVPAWHALDLLYRGSPDMLLYLLLIVWIADIGAFFVGRGFGRVKLAPAISPGKTWEGVLGGLSAALVLAAAGSHWFGIDLAILVPFSLAVAMVSVVGDLTVSMFKRAAGVKDSGTLFPGHGGVLDRIDSVAAAAPLFVLGMSLAGLS